MSDLLRYDTEKIITFFDCETYNLGLHESINLPWQVAMLKTKGGKILEEYNLYVKWPNPPSMSKKSAQITQYDPKWVEDKGVAPEAVLEVIDKELQKADYICGHNLIGFDSLILQSFYRKLNKKSYNIVPKILDTFALAKAIQLGINYNKKDNFSAWQYRLYNIRAKGIKASLAALGREHDVSHQADKLHSALNDLKLNLGVWNKLKFKIDI